MILPSIFVKSPSAAVAIRKSIGIPQTILHIQGKLNLATFLGRKTKIREGIRSHVCRRFLSVVQAFVLCVSRIIVLGVIDGYNDESVIRGGRTSGRGGIVETGVEFALLDFGGEVVLTAFFEGGPHFIFWVLRHVCRRGVFFGVNDAFCGGPLWIPVGLGGGVVIVGGLVAETIFEDPFEIGLAAFLEGFVLIYPTVGRWGIVVACPCAPIGNVFVVLERVIFLRRFQL
jgi:hypothetical protein